MHFHDLLLPSLFLWTHHATCLALLLPRTNPDASFSPTPQTNTKNYNNNWPAQRRGMFHTGLWQNLPETAKPVGVDVEHAALKSIRTKEPSAVNSELQKAKMSDPRIKKMAIDQKTDVENCIRRKVRICPSASPTQTPPIPLKADITLSSTRKNNSSSRPPPGSPYDPKQTLKKRSATPPPSSHTSHPSAPTKQ